MAIVRTGGNASNNSGSVSSFAMGSYTSHSGQDIVFVIVLGSTSSSVSSITNSAGTYGTFTLQASNNGTGVRVEVWTVHVTTGAATVFTINITGGATSIEANLEEYSGVNSIGHTDTASGTLIILMDFGVATQDGNNWVITGFGFACQSGDTLTAQVGNESQKSIPAATAVGGALYDNTQPLSATFGCATKLSTSRNWAAASIELRTAATAITAKDYGSTLVAALQANRDVQYLHCLEPLFAQQTPIQNVGSALNYGFVG